MGGQLLGGWVFAETAGQINEEIIRKYIHQQKGKP